VTNGVHRNEDAEESESDSEEEPANFESLGFSAPRTNATHELSSSRTTWPSSQPSGHLTLAALQRARNRPPGLSEMRETVSMMPKMVRPKSSEDLDDLESITSRRSPSAGPSSQPSQPISQAKPSSQSTLILRRPSASENQGSSQPNGKRSKKPDKFAAARAGKAVLRKRASSSKIRS
jgi:hypothetical protein